MLRRAAVQLKDAGRGWATAAGSRSRGEDSGSGGADHARIPLEPPWIVEKYPAAWFAAITRRERWPTGSINEWRRRLRKLGVREVHFGRSPAGDVIRLDADDWTLVDTGAVNPLYDALTRVAVARALKAEAKTSGCRLMSGDDPRAA
jgi:hypothetical protein